jgi:hypothetical protein
MARGDVIRLTDEDLARLDALAARIPVTDRDAIARAALNFGLDALEENPSPIIEEPLAIERILALHAEGQSLRAIAERLTEEGHRTRRGGAWAAETVRKVLAREDVKRAPKRSRKAR